MYTLPRLETTEEKDFYQAYTAERLRQEVEECVVCIYPKDVHKWLCHLTHEEFQQLLQHMLSRGFLGAYGEDENILAWHE